MYVLMIVVVIQRQREKEREEGKGVAGLIGGRFIVKYYYYHIMSPCCAIKVTITNIFKRLQV